MNAIRLLAASVVACLLTAGVRADDKKDEKKADNAKLIVGKWKITKARQNGPPEGTQIEFTKDGKISITVEVNGEKRMLEGTYKLDGNKMTITREQNGQENKQDVTIKKLDDTKLVVSGAEDQESELTRQK